MALLKNFMKSAVKNYLGSLLNISEINPKSRKK